MGKGLVAPLLAVVAAMAAFQVGAAFAEGLFPAVGPIGAATLRLCLAAVMLVALVRPWRAWPREAPLLAVLGLGLSMAGVIVFFYISLERLPLGVAIALQFLGPLAIALFGSRRAVDILWAALAAAGVWGLVGSTSGALAFDTVGVAWALAAAACWAGYILFGRTASAALGSATAAVSVGLAALFVLPAGVMEAGGSLLAPTLLPLALLVAVLSTALPFSLELYALPRMPPRTFAVFTSLEPAFGALAGLLILGERLAPAQVLGVGAVIVAAAGSAWTGAKAESGGQPLTVTDAPPA